MLTKTKNKKKKKIENFEKKNGLEIWWIGS